MDKAQPILDCYPPDTVQLSWIMGHDTLIRLFDPKYYKDVHADMAPFFERCNVICSSRPGYGTREEMIRFVEQSGHKNKVTLIDIVTEETESKGEQVADRMEISEMSSTVVRTAAKNQDWALVERCVLPSIMQFIKENGLYRT